MHEVSEHIEHAGHGGGQGGLSRAIGITIAVLGVLMALCSANVGAARTELIATMVEETGASLQYQTASTKNLMYQTQLQQLHALMPDPKFIATTDAELRKLEADTKKDSDTAKGIKATRLETRKILNTVTPSGDEVLRFMKLIEKQGERVETAKEWSESYKDAVEVHSTSASRFEIAMVTAEIGIVIASVALLLSSQKMFARGIWFAAILLGVLSMTIAGVTYLTNTQKLHGAEEKIAETHKHYTDIVNEKEDQKEDQALIEEIKRDVEELKKLAAESEH